MTNPVKQTTPRRGPPRLPIRTLVTLSLALGVVAAAMFYVGRGGPLPSLPSVPWGAGEGEPSAWRSRFGDLSATDRDLISQQRALVNELARRHVGTQLTGDSLDDLRVLQRILDRKSLAPGQTFELQALGVALGDVMAAQLGLSWVIFQDEDGRSRALRLGETDFVVFPVTMISKRVERDVPFTIEELYRKTALELEASGRGGRRAGA
jgi:hypothetical protein